MNGGQWLDTPSANGSHVPYKNWQPQGCLTHQYKQAELVRCVGDKKIVFAGDSTVRQVYWAVARKLNLTQARDHEKKTPKHSDQNFTSNGVRLEFIWDPFLNSSKLESELWAYSESKAGRQTEQRSPALMLLGAGAWFARWFDSAHSFPRFQLAIENVTAYMKPDISLSTSIAGLSGSGVGDQVFLAPVPTPVYAQLEGLRKDNILVGEMEKMNTYLRTLDPGGHVLWSYFAMTHQQLDAVQLAGLHVRESVADAKADILLNLRCNAVSDLVDGYPFDRTCCSDYQPVNWEQEAILGIAFLLGTVMLWNLVHGKEQRTVLSALFFVFATLAYCYIADRAQFFAKVKKHFVWNDFNLLCGIILLIAILSIRQSGKPSANGSYRDQPFLSRDQTEEWKGWMQFAILIYHWTGASSILSIYQVIRLLVASYLFLTGFGHTCYFLRKDDFSFRRVANVLVRLNLLSCALPYMMGTDYLFYYFAPLVTFWFSVVYLTMRCYASKNGSTVFVIGKILFATVLVTVILRTPAFDFLFSLLKTFSRIEWDIHEWKFRLSLDRYIVFTGMAIALFFERYNAAIASGTLIPSFNLIRMPAIALSLIAIPAMYTIYSTFASKVESNVYHPYLSPLPILAFITLRNATRTLRNYHSAFFAWLGTFSLETFVLQYHVWLAGDTKGLLSLGVFRGDGSLARDRWRDFLMLTPVFFWLSWRVAEATGVLTKAILHEEDEKGADTEGLLGNSVLAEKAAEPRSMATFGSKLRTMLWPKDLRARLALILLDMWELNLLW
jgi:hypothetical protein